MKISLLESANIHLNLEKQTKDLALELLVVKKAIGIIKPWDNFNPKEYPFEYSLGMLIIVTARD